MITFVMNFSGATMIISIETDASEAKIERLKQLSIDRCPVGALMDDAGVDWVFHHHAKTPHGFALPPSLGPPGRLYEPADRRSTQNMLALFREIFPEVTQNAVTQNAAGTVIP